MKGISRYGNLYNEFPTGCKSLLLRQTHSSTSSALYLKVMNPVNEINVRHKYITYLSRYDEIMDHTNPFNGYFNYCKRFSDSRLYFHLSEYMDCY